MDIDEIKAQYKRFKQKSRYLKTVCVFLFLHLFVFLPITLYGIILPSEGLYMILINIGILYAVAVSMVFFLMINLYGKSSGGITNIMIPIILSPVSVVHAPVYLTRDLFSRFDPIALAAYLLPRDAFNDFMRRELYRSEAASGIEDEFGWHGYWRMRRNGFQNLLSRLNRSEIDITTRQNRTDMDAAGYCPVCWAEYRSGFKFCSDCRVLLKTYAG